MIKRSKIKTNYNIGIAHFELIVNNLSPVIKLYVSPLTPQRISLINRWLRKHYNT